MTLLELPAPLPDPSKPLAEQDTVVLLAQCIWGEARGEEKQGKLAVGCVVRNRLRTRLGFGSTWNQVILQENAFSCFLKSDANYEKVMRPLEGQGVTAVSVWNECYGCAREIYYDLVVDPTHSATFYHDKRMAAPPHAELVDADWLIYESAWGLVQLTTKIGHLSFYRQVTRPAGNA
jgi:N-acetylmuramoyl-L-alanine amidase